jgi:hypothetical protein
MSPSPVATVPERVCTRCGSHTETFRIATVMAFCRPCIAAEGPEYARWVAEGLARVAADAAGES